MVRDLTAELKNGSYSLIEDQVYSVISNFEERLNRRAEKSGWNYEMPISANVILRNELAYLNKQLFPNSRRGYRNAVIPEECLSRKGFFGRVKSKIKGFFGF